MTSIAFSFETNKCFSFDFSHAFFYRFVFGVHLCWILFFCVCLQSMQISSQHDFILPPTHSRTSSSASSVGSSYVSSTDSNKTSHIESPTPFSIQSHTMEATNNFLNSNYHSTNGQIVGATTTLPRYQNSYNTLISELNDMNEHLNNTNDINNAHECINNDDDQPDNGHCNDEKLHANCNGRDETSIYGKIRSINDDDEFTYRTLNGGVIRSVHPPGKGNSTSYKVSTSLECLI